MDGSASSGRPSQASIVVQAGGPVFSQTPRGGTWTHGTR